MQGPTYTFISAAALPTRARNALAPNRRYKCTSTTRKHTAVPATARNHTPRMLQRPDGDGPPLLNELDDALRESRAMKGPPVTFGTSRKMLEATADASITELAKACVTDACREVQDLRMTYVTCTADMDSRAVFAAARAALPDGVVMLGRSVVKEGAVRTLEALALGGGTAFATASAMGDTAHMAGKTAAMAAADKLGEELSMGTFAIFASSASCEDADVRGGIAAALGGVPAYGGRACMSEVETGWTLSTGETEVTDDGEGQGTVSIALLTGTISFLISAVVKSWAQPTLVEKPSFLIPKYTGDDREDLLVSIKFDDWDVFEHLVDVAKVDVNHIWTARQKQSVLLAAAGRGRLRMAEFLLERGADVFYRNGGGFNAVMYTLRLKGYGEPFVKKQLDLLARFGADLNDTACIPH